MIKSNSTVKSRGIVAAVSLLMILVQVTGLQAGDLRFSDPANVTPPPAWAVGQANRSPDFDVLPGFQKPPTGFGTVPFFWWLGDPLTKERLGWILEQMDGMGVSGYQINYCHSDKGGRHYGLSYPSEPALFSEDWWKLTGWFMQEAKKQGAGVSLSDYTLGFGQGWTMDELLREHPEVTGAVLKMDKDGKVTAENVPGSLNPMHPMSGKWYAEKFFGQFERHFPGEGGKGLNFFFSDELEFGVSGKIWSEEFAEEFKKRKGYDITPELPALFKDIGPRTPKIRLDYSDVMVSLSEECYFRPVFDWHQQRGMTMGCDHGGRGSKVDDFGDYFRTQRWNQGPGADQPQLGKHLIKAKVASSIAHLYQRPRVWLEGYYGSGWGTTSAGFVDATFTDFVRGYNLLGIHGMYYATHGGWWEWAPPDNTFRMPYWKHMRTFWDCQQRLAYLLTQGYHRCDVAIMYPVAPMEAGMDGQQAVQAAFSTGSQLYAKGVDFDFMDFESLDRAKIIGKELHVSGEIYRVLILPAMKAIRHSTLRKAVEFHRAGGIVLALGALPEASDRIGRDDPEVAAMAKEIGLTRDVFAKLPPRDYEGPGDIQHRKIGPRDLYAIYNAPQGSMCKFRATGKVELWDPWTGTMRPLAVNSQANGITELPLPLAEKEIQLIVFSPGQPVVAASEISNHPSQIPVEGDWEFELQPTSDNRFGDFHWPPSATKIGAEVRQLQYCEGEEPTGPWRQVTCSFGPQFLRSSSMPPAKDTLPWEFSWRWGIEKDPGRQGYHGLKEEVHDEFLAIGQPKVGKNFAPNVITLEPEGHPTFFSTTVLAPRDMTGYALNGAIKPSNVWLNGQVVTGNVLSLKAGPNPLVLQYDKVGRTYFVVSTNAPKEAVAADSVISPPRLETPVEVVQPKFKQSNLAMRWWNDPSVLPFDVRAEEKKPVGWYRFVSPPGLREIIITARGKVQAWADDKPLNSIAKTGMPERFVVPQTSAKPVNVLLRIDQERGCYAGAALPEYIRLDCGPGQISLGDWSKNEGLRSYSGGAWYRKTVTIPAATQVILDLGQVVASAEVRVNGQPAGIRVTPPWKFDITKLVKPGENRLEVLVCNTMANHYLTVPTQFRGDLTSGLLGPVTIQTVEDKPAAVAPAKAKDATTASSPIPSAENIVFQYMVTKTFQLPKLETPPGVPVGRLFERATATAYLWIPPTCKQVRGMLVLGDCMPEQWLAGHASIRQACTEQGLAILYAYPSFRLSYVNEADKRILTDAQKAKHNIDFLQQILDELAAISGYEEIRTAPWFPIGESVSLQIVTQLTQFAPDRAIAGIWVQDDFCNHSTSNVPMLGIQGTGADWQFQTFDLFERWRQMATVVMQRNLSKRTSLPAWPGSQLIEAGSAHFSCTEQIIQLIARYVRAACKARLSTDGSPTLRPVDLNSGFVAGLPVPGGVPVKPKPYSQCTPAERNLPWYFDREFAQAAYDMADINWNAQTQVPVFLDDTGKIIPFNVSGVTDLKPLMEPDGVTFTVKAGYLDKVPADFQFHAGDPLTHVAAAPAVEWLKGPVIPLGANRFQIALDRSYYGGDVKPFLRTLSSADAIYHMSIRPGFVVIPANRTGNSQVINFDPVPDQPATAKEITLHATSDSGLPVRFFVKVGPAKVHGNKLVFTPIPLKSRMPIAVTVIAWQWGHASDPAVQTAPVVERTFQVTR